MIPQFKSVAEFLAMDGNGGFVFGAWGLSVGVIAILIGRAVLTGQRQKARLASLEAERQS